MTDNQNLPITRTARVTGDPGLHRLIVANKADAEFDAYGITNVVFNSDRKHYAYGVIGGSGNRDTVLVDGMEGKYYDSDGRVAHSSLGLA
jgi:hypothetical protein